MQKAMLDVLDFHQKMGQTIGDPRNPDITVDTQLRWDLIHEEVQELTLALEGKDKSGKTMNREEQVVAVADALGDIAYVVAGAAATWGIDLGGVFDAIHESNMTKKAQNKRSDGKVLKDKDYRPPNIKGALDMARLECDESGFGEDCWWPQPTIVSQFKPIKVSAEAQARHEKLKEAMQIIDKTASMFQENDPRDTEPTPLVPTGHFLPGGRYVFDCLCGRAHEVAAKMGSRGGLAHEGHAECICGKVYDVAFTYHKGKSDIDVEMKITDLGGIHA